MFAAATLAALVAVAVVLIPLTHKETANPPTWEERTQDQAAPEWLEVFFQPGPSTSPLLHDRVEEEIAALDRTLGEIRTPRAQDTAVRVFQLAPDLLRQASRYSDLRLDRDAAVLVAGTRAHVAYWLVEENNATLAECASWYSGKKLVALGGETLNATLRTDAFLSARTRFEFARWAALELAANDSIVSDAQRCSRSLDGRAAVWRFQLMASSQAQQQARAGEDPQWTPIATDWRYPPTLPSDYVFDFGMAKNASRFCIQIQWNDCALYSSFTHARYWLLSEYWVQAGAATDANITEMVNALTQEENLTYSSEVVRFLIEHEGEHGPSRRLAIAELLMVPEEARLISNCFYQVRRESCLADLEIGQ